MSSSEEEEDKDVNIMDSGEEEASRMGESSMQAGESQDAMVTEAVDDTGEWASCERGRISWLSQHDGHTSVKARRSQEMLDGGSYRQRRWDGGSEEGGSQWRA